MNRNKKGKKKETVVVSNRFNLGNRGIGECLFNLEILTIQEETFKLSADEETMGFQSKDFFTIR
jgi:hypothetical protein